MINEDVYEHRARLMEEMQNKRLASYEGDPKDFWKDWREKAVQAMIVENRVKSKTYKV